MDEPTNGLDPVSAHNLKLLVKEKLVEKEGKTVIFATHNLQDAQELCSRLAILQGGEIKFLGTMEEIRRKCKAEKRYVITLRNAGNSLLKEIDRLELVTMITSVPDGASQSVEIEVALKSDTDGLHKLVKEIIHMGGEIYSFQEKEPSLGELFPMIVGMK